MDLMPTGPRSEPFAQLPATDTGAVRETADVGAEPDPSGRERSRTAPDRCRRFVSELGEKLARKRLEHGLIAP